jgi:hypothetical protein
MKDLFVVRNGNKTVSGPFCDKQLAKAIRDEAGGVEGGFTVGRGPDHMGKHGDSPNGVPMMRRQPKAHRASV